MLHNDRPLETGILQYAGETNIFATELKGPEVEKDYEVLKLEVTASDADVVNFGHHQRALKLVP